MSVKLIKEEKEIDFTKEIRRISKETRSTVYSDLMIKAAKLAKIDLRRVIVLDRLSNDEKAFKFCENNFSVITSLEDDDIGEVRPTFNDDGSTGNYVDIIEIEVEIGKIKGYSCIHEYDGYEDTYIITPDLYNKIK